MNSKEHSSFLVALIVKELLLLNNTEQPLSSVQPKGELCAFGEVANAFFICGVLGTEEEVQAEAIKI